MIYNLNKFSNAKLICVQIFEVKFGGGGNHRLSKANDETAVRYI